ncbi:TraC family protein [Pseudoalteromonas rubra]|uniref:TraG P-loop domain-containing protein n=1 Tax=Pseudoalteromonas rubra TaxID=43658 RepID=A0A0U2ZED2_9GAMM|nr:TraC family protein [Pseudoalteromonas rubra]ALU46161.1 hypothetical protein AT705_24675 [Pseudoalteromonas rubra]
MSAYEQQLNSMIKHDRFCEFMPYLEYWEDEKAFLLDGPYLGMMMAMSPTNGGNRNILNSLNTLYKYNFPKGTLLQASVISTPDIEDMLFGFRRSRFGRYQGADQEQAEALAMAMHDFYRSGSTQPINEKNFLFRNYEVWFCVKIPLKSLSPSDKELVQFQGARKQMRQSLAALGAHEVDERGLRRKLRVMFNMYDQRGWRTRPQFKETSFSSHFLRDTVLAEGKSVDVSKRGVSIKDDKGNEVQYIRSLSMTDTPERMVYGQMMDLLGDWLNGQASSLPGHFMMTLNMHYDDKNEAIKNIQSKRSFINSQAKGKLLQKIDRLRFQNEDFNAINREIDQEKSSIVDYALQMTSFTPDVVQADRFSERFIADMEQKNVLAVENSYFMVPMLISALPMGLSKEIVVNSGRYNVCSSKALPFLTPHMGSWKGNTAEPRFFLSSRLGQVVNLDFFASDSNYNFYLGAMSGAGKSYFTGYLISNLLSSGVKLQSDPDDEAHLIEHNDGTRVFVIDVGRSYEGLAAQFDDAQFLVFGNEFEYTLNPLSYIHEFEGKEGQGIQCLQLLKTMAAPSGNISDLQHSQMLTLLSALWEQKGRTACIDDFAQLCKNSEHQEVKRIGFQLAPFCKQGYYARFFDPSKPPVNYSSRLMIVELEELKSDPHLQTIALMSAIMSIQQEMYLGGTDSRKLFLLDEAWEYLKGDDETKSRLGFFSAFLETAWRRFRKYNAAGGLITQSILDGYNSDVGKAILNNSAWLLVMLQREEAVKELRKTGAYSGSEIDFKLIESVHTVQPNPAVTDVSYSEVFIKYQGQAQVCRLHTNRRFQLILTTKGDEKARRKELMEKEGLSLIGAIDRMIELEQAGVQ